jgi:hypothetical protein
MAPEGAATPRVVPCGPRSTSTWPMSKRVAKMKFAWTGVSLM